MSQNPGIKISLAWHAGLVLAVALACLLEHTLFRIGGHTVMTPAVGLAFAAVLIGGRMFLVSALAGMVAGQLLLQQNAIPVVFASTTLTLQVLVSVCLLQRFLPVRRFLHGVRYFNGVVALPLGVVILVNFLLGKLVPALVLNHGLAITGALEHMPDSGYPWTDLILKSFADTLGILTFGMAILTLRHDASPWPERRRLIWLALSVVAILAVLTGSRYAYLQLPYPDLRVLDFLPYMLLPAVTAVYAQRYPPRVIAWLLLLFAAATALDFGHRSYMTMDESRLMMLQLFIGIYVAVAMSISILGATTARAREELMYKERRYRVLVENAPEAILVVDAAGKRILDVNHRATEMLGYSRAELLEMAPARIFIDPLPRDDDPTIPPVPLRQAMSMTDVELVRPVEAWVANRHGQRIVCEMRRVTMRERGQRSMRISLTDVSQRLDMEQQRLKLEQEKMTLLEFQQLQMNLMPVACLITDTEFRYTYWNPAAERMFGYATQDVVGCTPFETIVPAREFETIEQRRRQLMESGETRGINTNCRKDGRELVCEWHNAVLRNSSGETIGYLSMAVDITQRAQAELELRESQERYRRMVEHSMEGIGIVRNGNLVYVNLAFVEILRAVSAEELIGRALRGLFMPEYREAIEHWLQQMEELGVASGFTERRLLRMDGETAEVEVSGTRVMIEGSQYVQVHVRDIGARKWTEREILRMNADLEQRVLERTAELSEANRELESFSYTVAHDLRSPLRAISGFSGILLQDFMPQLSPDAQNYLRRISANADRMGELIEDLLTFAQVGRVEARITEVNMDEVTRSVVEGLREEYPHTEVTQHPLPTIIGDRGLLRQFMFNLLSNAFKFSSGQASPQVEVGMATIQEEQVFFVRDNGVGFDPAYGHKLFGVFQRLHAVYEFEGTGVGLAIVQRIAQRHGGRVWAESAPNCGATFYFVLPLQPVEDRSASSARPAV